MAKDANILKESGKPLFFEVANPQQIGFAAPDIRDGRGEAVRVAVRSLTVMQKEALVASARTGKVWRLASDEGAYLDGHDYAPCPLSFLSTGMVCSYMNEILALAERRGISIRKITLVQDNYYTMKGSALQGTMTGGAENIDLEAIIDCDTDNATLTSLIYDAVAASPLNGLMRGEKESLFSLVHNGRQIDNGDARPIGGSALPDPGDTFGQIEIGDGDWSGLIRHTGKMTAKTEEATTLAGGSLTDQQNRRLHPRVICTLRPDGMKEIEQHLFNPHGSIFRFLSEEAPENGGKGRAPDACSYIAAGIGFCFMTQFGRYAKIVKKPLDEYRIIQDFHATLGGASGGTGRAGEADPLETHCYLFSEHDDEFARKCLDMSEQTCFLHAFCRTDLKARVKVTRESQVA
ncbi:MAG: OsmC family peroxiredoxin [Pseudomonadota bacterium]